jgi:hypothetical protein
MHLPNSVNERLLCFSEVFPCLSVPEREDLARIEPWQFGLYRKTIFRGEANLLQRVFPLSFSILKKVWPDVYGESFSPVRFALKMHQSNPWRTATTLGLAKSFLDCVVQELEEVKHVAPELCDAARMELLTLESQREERSDESLKHSGLLESELPKLRFDELLRYRLVKSFSFRHAVFEFDVVGLREQFMAASRELPDHAATAGLFFACCARKKNHTVSWMLIPEGVYKIVSDLKTGEGVSLSLLAVLFAADCGNQEDERHVALEFLRVVFLLLNGGHIHLLP